MLYNKKGELRRILTYLPSRKIIYAIATVLLVSAGLFWFFKNRSAEHESQKNKNLFQGMLENVAKEFNNLDSNNDGLKDWEEVLHRVQDDGGFNNLSSSSSINLTRELAKSMGVQVASLKEGEIPDVSDSLKLIDKSTNRNLLEFIAGFHTQISEKELKISQDNGSYAVKKYSSDVSEAIPRNPYPQKSEDDIFAEAMNTKNFRIIDEYIQYYEQAIKNMKNVVAPSDFLAIHKREIELFIATKKVYESIKEIDKDPLKTVLALQQNEKIREEMKNLIINFMNLVQKHS